MEARTIGIGVSVAVMGTFASILIYSLEVDSLTATAGKLRTRSKEVQSDLQGAKDAFKRAEGRMEALKQGEKQYKELSARVETAEQKRQALQEQIKQLDSQPAKLAAELNEAIAEARRRGVGMEFPTLALKNGKTIQSAKLQKVTAEELTFGHSLGLARVGWKDAPEDLVARFKLGPIVQDDPPEDKKGAAPPPADDSAIVDIDVSVPKGNLADAKAISDKIAKIQNQINAATVARQKWAQRADEYRQLHYRALSMGRSSSHMLKVTEAERQMDKIDSQIAAARKAILALDGQLSSAQNDAK